jgi:hypothetical protein
MPQTLLGLLALVLASLISFNQQRLTQQSYRSALRDEVELAASGTAQHVVEMIGARSFDEESTPNRVFAAGGVPTGSGSFSSAGAFASDRGARGCDLMDPSLTPDCDDVDDLHGLRNAPVEARLSDGRTLDFTADVDVAYVASPGATQTSTDPTLHKRVQLTLRSSMLGLTNGVLTLTRVISYDPIKADADMETRCGAIGAASSPCTTGGGGTVEGPG